MTMHTRASWVPRFWTIESVQRQLAGRRRFLALAGGAALAGMPLAGAYAEAWPAKPVTLIIPYAPGGTTDIMGRILAQSLGKILGKAVVPENHGGAGGTIAGGLLARATPDGYTIMLEHIGFAFNVTLYRHLGYDAMRDITPVAYVGDTPNVLVVTNSMPVHSMKQFLDYARAHPGGINYGSGGVGSAGHLAMAWLASKEHLEMTHIPYKGSGPALTDLISGRINAMLLTIPAVLPYIHSKQVRPIATSGAVRAVSLPQLPTIEESGVKGFVYAPWYGVFAPAGTPPNIIARLHDAINRTLSDPDTAKKMLTQGLTVQTWSRQKFQQQVKDDVQRWGTLIKSLKIHMN